MCGVLWREDRSLTAQRDCLHSGHSESSSFWLALRAQCRVPEAGLFVFFLCVPAVLKTKTSLSSVRAY